MIAKVERTAAMREPAHDHLIARQYLLSIDTEILTRLVGTARHRQSPRNERARIVRPARLYRQPREIDVGTLPDDLLARRARAFLGRHVEDFLQHWQLVPGILQAARRIGLLEIGEQLADLAQRLD